MAGDQAPAARRARALCVVLAARALVLLLAVLSEVRLKPDTTGILLAFLVGPKSCRRFSLVPEILPAFLVGSVRLQLDRV